MSRTDLVADVFTLIRNASRAKHEKVDVPASKLVEQILHLLKREGFIENYKAIQDKKQGLLRVYLRFMERKQPLLIQIRKISKPGLRKYTGYAKIPRVRNGLGVAIISSSRGILTDNQCREMHVGGEILGYVW